MPAIADYPRTRMPETSPERPSAPIGRVWGLVLGDLAIGTGSQRIVIQEQRPEPALAREVCNQSMIVPEYVLRRLRMLSGLTWEELSIAMDVSKRALHLWDAGNPLKQKHLAHLHRVSGLVERLASGNPVHLRNLLLKDLGGTNGLTLLRERRYDLVERQLATERAFPVIHELPAGEFRKRLPSGVPISSYLESETMAPVQSKPLKAIKPPKLWKG